MAQGSLNNMYLMLSVACGDRKGLNCGNYIHTFLLFQTTFDLDVVDTITVTLAVKSCQITLGNNFLLFECCLKFYNWFRVFLHCWVRKWHPFLCIRSGFWVMLIWKNRIFWFLLCDLVFNVVILWYETKLRLLLSLVHPRRVSVHVLHTMCGAQAFSWLPSLMPK